MVGHWCVLMGGPCLVVVVVVAGKWEGLEGGVEPGGGSSVIQDDLNKTGHVCLFGVMQREKRVFLEEKNWNTSQNLNQSHNCGRM